MNKVLNIYKPIGFTPLQIIHKLRESYPEYRNAKIGYAGRLDPMARGVLLLMIGDATRERDKYLNLDKEYVFEALFGFGTDTFDILGIVNKISDKNLIAEDAEDSLKDLCKSYPRKFMQKYPPYSSKTVGGKALFEWSREGKIEDIEIPEKEIEIYDLELLSSGTVNALDLLNLINEKVDKISGDFRQEQILEQWENVLKRKGDEKLVTAKFRIICSSGTYVRRLVHEMGIKTGTGAVTIDILRTKAGAFDIADSIKLVT